MFRPIENILVKLTINKEFGTFVTKLPPNHCQYKKHSIRNVSRNGINYYLDISDLIDWFIYWGFQEVSMKKLFSLIREGDYVVDVGANVGAVTLNAAKLVGDKGRVFSFEPDPVNFIRLQRNFSLNKFDNIKLTSKALGDIEGKGFIRVVTERNLGGNRLSTTGTPIEIITLDDFIKREKINRVDLIKIDTEGYEMHVLKGAIQTLKTFKPKLFIEIDDNNLKEQGASALELIKYLENLGYKLTNAETDKEVNAKQDFSNCHFDAIGLTQ